MKKLIFLSLLSIALTSCGVRFSGTVDIPLPEELGGGSIPITIHPAK